MLFVCVGGCGVEKTFAREIYKRMEIGQAYKMSDLMALVDMEARLFHFPNLQTWDDVRSFDFRTEFHKAMDVMVSNGYVRTETRNFVTAFVKGRKFGSHVPTADYAARVWIRVK